MKSLKKEPLISIIINCYNGEKYLNDCIKSALDQSYKNLEIIFFDNSSTDQSIKTIKKFKDKRIKFFYSQKKIPLSLYKARNLAIACAKGEYVTFLDTDDLWEKKKLEKQIKLIKKNSNTGIVYSNSYVLNEKNKKKYILHKRKLPSGYITQKLLDNYSILIVTLLIKKKLLTKYKFQGQYSIIGDFDLMVRLSMKFKILCVQESLSTYRIHGDNLSFKRIDIYIKELKQWLKKNNKILVKYKYNSRGVKFHLFKLKLKFILKKYFKFLPLFK